MPQETTRKQNSTKPKKLTDAQKNFCREYIKDGNAKAAAIRAGYSARAAACVASRLKKNTLVMREIERLQDKVQEKAVVDAAWVLTKWKDVIETCTQKVLAYSMTGAPLKLQDGKQAYKMIDANTARNVLADLAKHLKMFDKAEEKDEDDGSGVLFTKEVESPEQWQQKE